MDIQDDRLVKIFFQSRDLKPGTEERYLRALTLYSEFINKTPTEWIQEAENEEENRIRMRQRKIKQYQLDFKDYLLTKDFTNTTIAGIITGIRTFYTEFDIELGKLKLNRTKHQETIADIPDKNDIRLAMEYAIPKYKSIITLMLSSGMGASEITSLTYQNFLDSISEYLKTSLKEPLNVEEIISKLDINNNLIVPSWNVIRIKTGMYYTTFSTPESLNYLLKYLHYSPPQNVMDKLYRTKKNSSKGLKLDALFRYFTRLNNQCGFGKPYRQSYLRSHALRKLFATTLYSKNIQQTYVDFFLGHRINSVTESYFKSNPKSLKEQYIGCIEDLSIQDTEVHTIESKEYKEIKSLRSEVDELKRIIEDKNEYEKLP